MTRIKEANELVDNPNLPKWLRNTLFFLAVAPILGLLLSPIAWLLLEVNYRSGTYKILMPGTHKIFLSPDEYQLIVFTRWPSKNVNLSDKSPISMKINQAGGSIVPIESSNDVFTSKEFQGQNTGGIWGMFNISQPGSYCISSSNKFVVIITPQSRIQWGFGEWKCPGSDDDFGFAN